MIRIHRSECFELKVEGAGTLGLFRIESRWEGLMKIVPVDGTSTWENPREVKNPCIICSDIASTVFEQLLQGDEPQELNIVSTNIAKIMDLELGSRRKKE